MGRRRKDRECQDCGADISLRGGRSKRCGECQDAADREYEAERYESSKDAISTRRQLQRRGISRFEPQDRTQPLDGRGRRLIATTDYEAEQLRFEQQHPGKIRAEVDDEEPEVDDADDVEEPSWAPRARGQSFGERFRPFADPERGTDAWGRPTPRSRPDRGGTPVPNPFMSIVRTGRTPTTADVVASAEAPAQQLYAGHFESNTLLAEQEKISAQNEVEQRQAASNVCRSIAPEWR